VARIVLSSPAGGCDDTGRQAGGTFIDAAWCSSSTIDMNKQIRSSLIEERTKHATRRLGRHQHFDERSRKFSVRENPFWQLGDPGTSASPEVMGLRSRTWLRRIAAFNQGALGSCTGNAVVGLLATAPFRRTPEHDINEKLAVQDYSRATEIDPFDGKWPPDDTGSSVLAALKALVQLGRAKEYRWCFGSKDVLPTLSYVAPVAIGVNWYDSFDRPDATGLVRLTPGARIRGGHAFLVLGINVALEQVIAENSWGPGFGVRGRFRFSVQDLDRLLREDGEAATIVRW